MYLSANCFNVTEDFLDSAVLFVDAFFSRGKDTRTFKDTLLLGEDVRNFRLNIIGGAKTPTDPPINPNVKTLSSANDRFLDLIKIPIDTSFITYHVDSIKLSVPRRRKVFFQNGTALHIDGGTRLHAISFATKYDFDVEHFSQSDSTWKDSLLNNITGKTMGGIGCAVTSGAMLLNYFRVHALDGTDLTPLKLLQWLNANSGFSTGKSDIQWGKIADFSVASHNIDSTQARLKFEGVETNLDSIEQYLSRKIPMLLRVRSRSSTNPSNIHFILARGITPKLHPNHSDSLRGSYKLSDPGGNFPTLMSYLKNGGTTVSSANPSNRFIQVQRYSVVSDPNVDFSWMSVRLYCPAEILITDPFGRRLGFDPITSTSYDEIPQASYEISDPLADDQEGSETTEEFKEATIIAPVDGQYLMQIIGTGTGAYTVTRSFTKSDGLSSVEAPVITSSTIPGQIDDYHFVLNKATDKTNPKLAPVANIYVLWPPNHQMVDIVINSNAEDNSGMVHLSASVSSNEPVNGLGDGDTAPDWTEPVIDEATGTISLQLRSERSGQGNGRVYSIVVTASDDAGNSSSSTVEIKAPHSKGKQ